MKNVWTTIFGIIDVLACISLAVFYYVWILEEGTSLSNALTWGLPVLIAAIVALVSGIYAVKKGSWIWAISGFIVAGAVWIYCLVLIWIVGWTMA